MKDLHETSVLVTGAAGFVGQHLVAKLKRMRFEVVATDLRATDNVVPLDLRDKVEVDETVKETRPEIIVHLASRVGNEKSLGQPYDFYINNILGTLNICDVAVRSGVEKIVYLSTAAVYGNIRHEDLPITEGTEVNPITPYAASKLCGEILVKEHARRTNMTAVIFRPTNIYGPKQTEMNAIQKFIDDAISGMPIELYGDGSHTREFIFIEDAVDAIIAAINAKGLSFDKFIVSTGEPISLSDLAKAISTLVGGASIRHVKTPHLILSQRYDISRAQTHLRWRPRVSLEKGLIQTLEWRRKISVNK